MMSGYFTQFYEFIQKQNSSLLMTGFLSLPFIFADADPSFFHLVEKTCLMMCQNLSAVFLGWNDSQIILKICKFSQEPC